jgi:hypothetical protein
MENIMMLDEFQTKWIAHEQKLDAIIRLNRQLLQRSSLDNARTALQRQKAFAMVNAISSWLSILVMAWFIAKHHSEAQFILPAALIGVYFIANMIAYIRQVRALARIDYVEPIAAIQKQIERVALMRIRLTQWTVMSVALLWVPIAIVMAEALLGLNLYAVAPLWLVENLIFGIVCLAAIFWWLKRYGIRSNSLRVQRVVRDLVGDNLTAASAFLADLADFEKEERHT